MAGEAGKRSSGSTKARDASSRYAFIPLGKHLGKSAIPLTRPVIVVGSRESCRIHLNSSSVSQIHALLVRSGGTYYVHDLASRNHVIVSEKRVETSDLRDGDEVRIGSFILKFTGPATKPGPAAPAATLQLSQSSRRIAADATENQDTRVNEDTKPIAIGKRVLLIGRRPGSDILLADAAVSTSHAVIFEMDGQRVVRDLGSRTGTWVNGVQVHQHILSAGDRVKIGPSTYHYQLAPAKGEAIAEAAPDGQSSDTSDIDFGLDFDAPTESIAPIELDFAPDVTSEVEATPLAGSAEPLDVEDVDESAKTELRRSWRAVVAEPSIPVAPDEAGVEAVDAEVAAANDRAAEEKAAEERAAAEKVVAEKEAAEKAERDRVDAEKIEAEHLAAQQAEAQRLEAERLEEERIEQERIEQERLEAERIETERLVKQAEEQRLASAKAATEKAATEKAAAEQLAAEKAASERAAAEELAAEEAERQRIEAERIALENAAALANERLEIERREAEQLEIAQREAEQLEAEKLEAEKLSAETADAAQNAVSGEHSAETIAATEPSPESALEFELNSLALSADRESDSDHVGEPDIDFDPVRVSNEVGRTDANVDPISDSAFGRAVEAFSGDLSGSIVEPIATADGMDAVADASDETVDDILGDADSADLLSPADAPIFTADTVLDAGSAAGSQTDAQTEPGSPPELTFAPIDPLPDFDSPESIELSTAGTLVGDSGMGAEDVGRSDIASQEFVADDKLLATTDPGRVLPDELAHDPFDLSAISASTEDLGDVDGPTGDATIAPSAETVAKTVSQPVEEIEAPPAVRAPTPARGPGAANITAEDRGRFWGTEATVLGGMPLELPAEQPDSLFADGKPVEPPASAMGEDDHIDAVSQMIGDLLQEAVLPSKSPAAPPPAPLSDASADAEVESDSATAPQKRSRRPLRRGPSTPAGKAAGQPLRIDEQIPPFGTVVPNSGNSIGNGTRNRTGRRDMPGRREEIAAVMESLSRPPVHETDVFSHGSMPSDNLLAPNELSEDPLAPRGRPRVLPVAPNDLLGDASTKGPGSDAWNNGVPRNGMRGAVSSGPALRSPSGPRGGTPNVGRIDLPNDPFWSGGSNPPAPTRRRNQNDNGNGNAISEANGGDLLVGGDLPVGAPHSADEEIGLAGDASLSEVAERLADPSRDAIKKGRSINRRNGPAHGAANPTVTYAAEVDPSIQHEVRRRRFVRVSALLLGGTVLAVGAFYGCLKFVPVHSQVEARVKYTHLTDAREETQRSFRSGQADILRTEGRRIAALHNLPPDVAPGFLADQAAYMQIVSNVAWPSLRQDVLSIRFQTTEPDADSQRIKAVAQALYDANGILIDDANRNRDRLADATERQNNLLRQLSDLQQSIEQNRAIADSWPPVEKIAALTANAEKLNKAWKDAEVAQKTAQAEIERLKSSDGGPDSKISTDASAPAGSPDANTQQMQAELQTLQQKLGDSKNARDHQQVQARADLDSALSQFQKQVDAARELSKDNPDLQNYANAAQRLQETTRKLVDDHIRRQQQSYSQITNLQASLGEEMQKKREEMWEADDKLKSMNDQLGYVKRQYNTAIGTGQEKDAADLKAQVDLLENMIKAREDTMPDDPIYSRAVDGLQKMVEQQKLAMSEDRQQSDELLNSLQKSFADSQPAIDKLPAQQKTLAADMEKRLADLNAARAKLNDAATAGTSDDATRAVQDQISQLNASIDSRKKQLADESAAAVTGAALVKRKADLNARESELPKLAQAVTDTKNAYWAADASLQDARHAVEMAKTATDKGTELTNEKIRLNAQLEIARNDVDQRQDAARTSIEPVQIADSDIQRQLGADNRALYGSISSASILLIAGLLILLTIHAANQELPLNAMDPTDDAVDPFWQSSAGAAANGHPVKESIEPFPGANALSSDEVAADSDIADSDIADPDIAESSIAGPDPALTDQTPAVL